MVDEIQDYSGIPTFLVLCTKEVGYGRSRAIPGAGLWGSPSVAAIGLENSASTDCRARRLEISLNLQDQLGTVEIPRVSSISSIRQCMSKSVTIVNSGC